MDVAEQLKKAWEAVEKSGVPEPLQAMALQEAMASIRAAEAGTDSATQKSATTSQSRSGAKASATPKPETETAIPDEATFFAKLAEEAGVKESDLRDVLQLTADGNVHVTTPTRQLGSSVAKQAQTVIALVAGGRAVGLDERPVSAAAVRKELERKRCYLPNNFSAQAPRSPEGLQRRLQQGRDRHYVEVGGRVLGGS